MTTRITDTKPTVYKEGLLQPRYTPADREIGAPGMAICNCELGRDLDLYFDFTVLQNHPALRDSRIVHPKEHPDILKHAKAFASKHDAAHFALLRIWGSPYFYHLVLGHDNKDFTSFIDSQERCWKFKFVPNDMQSSEWSIHWSIHSMLLKFAKPLGYEEMGKAGKVTHRMGVISGYGH